MEAATALMHAAAEDVKPALLELIIALLDQRMEGDDWKSPITSAYTVFAMSKDGS